MHQPMGFKDATHPNHVCLLKKSLYGLKQAPRLGINDLRIMWLPLVSPIVTLITLCLSTDKALILPRFCYMLMT